jgi:hypothetical protein
MQHRRKKRERDADSQNRKREKKIEMKLLESSYRIERAFSHMGKERVGQDNVHEEKVVQRGKRLLLTLDWEGNRRLQRERKRGRT